MPCDAPGMGRNRRGRAAPGAGVGAWAPGDPGVVPLCPGVLARAAGGGGRTTSPAARVASAVRRRPGTDARMFDRLRATRRRHAGRWHIAGSVPGTRHSLPWVSRSGAGRGFGWAAAVLMTAGAASRPTLSRRLEPVRPIQHWDSRRVARSSHRRYDLVPTSPRAGSRQEGRRGHAITHGGVTYRFVSKANADLFRAAARYGRARWCSWAMINGEKTSRPESVHRARAAVPVLKGSGYTRASWLKGTTRRTRGPTGRSRVSGETADARHAGGSPDAKREEMNRTLPPAMKETFEKGIRDGRVGRWRRR